MRLAAADRPGLALANPGREATVASTVVWAAKGRPLAGALRAGERFTHATATGIFPAASARTA